MRLLRALVAIGLAAASTPASSATLLFLNSDAEYVGGGRQELLVPADGTFGASGSPDVVEVDFEGGPEFWTLHFAAPNGAALAPGVYENAERWPFQSPTLPGLDVSGDGRGCNTLSGQFVVLDVAFGPGGDLVRFAADFEQHCEEAPNPLVGSIRFDAGDVACASAPDGSPCDDLDACTATSTCQGGVCAGAAPTSCPVVDDGCHQSGLCDPATGACATAYGFDGVSCSSHDACTVETGTCAAGHCVADPMSCDTGNVCADETCDPAIGQCVSTPLPCWSIHGRTTATASIPGRSVQQSARFTGVLVLRKEGTYRAPGGLESCPTGQVTVPDEVGTIRPGKRGRLVLEPSNLDEIAAATSQCTGYRTVIRSYRSILLQPSGTQLRGTSRLVARAHAAGHIVTVVAVSRFVGSLQEAAAASPSGLAAAVHALAAARADVASIDSAKR